MYRSKTVNAGPTHTHSTMCVAIYANSISSSFHRTKADIFHIENTTTPRLPIPFVGQAEPGRATHCYVFHPFHAARIAAHPAILLRACVNRSGWNIQCPSDADACYVLDVGQGAACAPDRLPELGTKPSSAAHTNVMKTFERFSWKLASIQTQSVQQLQSCSAIYW